MHPTDTHDLEIDLRDPSGVSSLLGRVTLLLNSTLELPEVLRRLARIGRDATNATHCSVFLLEGRRLIPTTSVGDEPDDGAWKAFRSLGPIPLTGLRWKLLARGGAVTVTDAAESDLVPDVWRERFRPRGLALVPLVAEGSPCGLLALDWTAPRRFDRHDVTLLESLGAAAGVAVRNAHLYADARRRASFQEALTHCAETLVSTLEPEEIARRLVDAYTEMTGARACIIGLFDSERATLNALASRGLRLPAAPIPLTAVPRHILERAWKGWEQARVPLEFGNDPWFHEEFGGREAGAGWYLLSPLVAGERTPGCVLLGFAADHRLDAEGRSGVAALTSIASAAVERALLHRRLERRTRELDALYRASAALTEGADVPAMLEELNALLEVHGVRVVSVAFRDERLARRLRAEPLTTAERDALRGRCGWESVAEDWAAVPMPLGRRIFGVLRVEPRALAPWQRTFLGTIAHGLAEVAQRDDLRTSVELAATERALVEERDRMASDLHDTVGQVFVAIGLLIGARRERLDPANAAQALLERLADLAERGKWEIDQAARALAFVPALRRGLVDSARSLAADVEGDSGLRIRVRVTGRVARLDGVTERALYRVAHEGIANAWRHAQCTSVGVHLRFEDDDVTLRVDDDGAGAPDSLVEGSGIAGMRKALKECGGDLVIETAPGAGLALEARVPRTAP